MWLIIAKAKLYRILFVFCAAVSLLLFPHLMGLFSADAPRGMIALIIDDFGNHGDGTEAIINLGIPLTAAVMPFRPHSVDEARIARAAGLEVIMHVPMEPEHGDPSWLGSMGITTDLSDAEIEDRILRGLAQIQPAVGLNNHMGSRAIQDRRVMSAVLRIAKQRGLFFIDSMTTPRSVAGEIAQEMKVPYLARDIFLDNERDPAHIQAQLTRLGDIALERGFAVGIGHVGVEGGTVTADALRKMIPVLQDRGIQFIFASRLIRDGNGPP